MSTEDRRRLSLETVFWLVDAVVYHVQAWIFTRRPWLLVQALPALVVGGGVLAIFASQFGGPDNDLVSRYDLAVEDALARDDLPTAKVYSRKLVLLDELGPTTRYALARVAEHEGDLFRARRLMSELAPTTGSGYPSAHFWMAKQLLGGKPQGSPVRVAETVHHLEESLSSSQNRQQAHEWLGQLYLAKEELDEAVTHFEEAASRCPELYLTLAEIHVRQKDDARFLKALKLANEHFRDHVEKDENDIVARLSWARGKLIGEDYEEAEKILLDGLLRTDDRRLYEMLTLAYVAMADQYASDNAHDLAERLELLKKALRYTPSHPEALNRLATFVRHTGPEADAARAMLKDLLATGQVPATVHLVLGSSAAAEGKWDEARLHLEQAYRADKRLPAVLNNLAWALTNADPPELDRALSLADAALELAPNHPEIRATRGQILARLERWHDAVSDLELALADFPDRTALHGVLADAYTALGDDEMAERHRALAGPEDSGGSADIRPNQSARDASTSLDDGEAFEADESG